MLTFSEAQWRALQAQDTRQFIAAACDQFFVRRPEMQQQAGRPLIFERMQAAHDLALRLGLGSTPHVVHLMFLAADAPGIIADPALAAYLGKPGATPKQRLDNLLAVMRWKSMGAA